KGLEATLTSQYLSMLEFVLDQHEEIIDFLPGEKIIKDNKKEIADSLAKTAMGNLVITVGYSLDELFTWPLFDGLPTYVKEKQKGRPLLKQDRLCENVEYDVDNKRCYFLSRNTGSRPQPEKSL